MRNRKPDPEPLISCLRKMSVTDYSSVLYVGDSIVDAEAARAAKKPFIGVLHGTTKKPIFETYPHVALVDNFSDMLQLLH